MKSRHEALEREGSDTPCEAYVMAASADASTNARGHDLLDVAPVALRNTIRVTIDRELIDELERRRGSSSRSEYLEMVLAAAFTREHPHLPDQWTPENAAEQRFQRLVRYSDTGH